MGASLSGKMIDRVVAAGVAAWFRKAAFRRRGRTFFRQHDALFLTSAVQASKVNALDKAIFVVNLGVEWPYWHHVWTGRELAANPALAPAFVQARLHPSLGWGQDHWWSVNPDVDPSEIADEVVAALQAHADRFWKRYSDLDSVLEEFEVGTLVPTGTPKRLVHAALLARAGRADDAKQVIAEAARRRPRFAAGFLRVSERLGLGDYAA
jgi:hypothetical protein